MDISTIIISLEKIADSTKSADAAIEVCDGCNSEPCVCDQEICGTCAAAPCVCSEPTDQNIGAALAELTKLSGIQSTVTESTLVEITNTRSHMIDGLRHLGAVMINMAEKADHTGTQSAAASDAEFNKMLRIGEILADLGEPGSVPLNRLTREDLTFVAQKLNLPLELFLKKVGIHEGLEMRPYQGENDLEPMSKKQVMGDQPLVNNTGDNSMIDSEKPVKKLAMKTIKESAENGYICFYKGKQLEVHAASSYEAQKKAAEIFKAKKSHEVSVHLAQKDGEDVVHTATEATAPTIKQFADIIREMELRGEQFRVGDSVRVASDNMHYGDRRGHVTAIDPATGDLTVDMEDFGSVKLPPRELHKNHAMHPMFETGPYEEDARVENSVQDALNNFDVKEFLEHSGSDFGWEDRNHPDAQKEYTTQYILSSLTGYLEHWIQQHRDEHVDLENSDVTGLLKHDVLPYLRENGFRISPELKSVEDVNEDNGVERREDICPECHSEPCQCDTTEVKEADGDDEEDNDSDKDSEDKDADYDDAPGAAKDGAAAAKAATPAAAVAAPAAPAGGAGSSATDRNRTNTETGGSSPGGASTGGVGSGIGGAGTGGAATGGASTGGAGTVNVTLSGNSGTGSNGGKTPAPVTINISNVGGTTDAGNVASGDGPGSAGEGGKADGSDGGGGGGAAPDEPNNYSTSGKDAAEKDIDVNNDNDNENDKPTFPKKKVNSFDSKDLTEGFTYGDKVVITGDKHHMGDEGEIVSMDKERGTVIVKLDGHGRMSFPLHSVSKPELEEEGALLDAAPVPPEAELAHTSHDLHSLAKEITAADDTLYNEIVMDLFGYSDPERIISEQHIVDQLTSLNPDEVSAISAQLWIPVNDGESVGPYSIGGEMDPTDPYDASEHDVDEGNSHDDLRASPSDHDTLMHKNTADAHKGLSGNAYAGQMHELDEADFDAKMTAKDITDRILKLDDKNYVEACKLIYEPKNVYKPHDKIDIFLAVERHPVEVKNFLDNYDAELNKIGMESVDSDEEALTEKAPPDQEAWVKANKAKFKKEYGDKKGEEILYATAWKKHNESVESLESALTEEFNKLD